MTLENNSFIGEYRDSLNKINSQLASYKNNFGKTSYAYNFALYIKLSTQLNYCAKYSLPIESDLITTLNEFKKVIKINYQNLKLNDTTESYTYSPQAYAKYYRHLEHKYVAQIVSNAFYDEYDSLLKRFIYIISLDNQIRIYAKPIPTKVILFGRCNELNFPAHPILSREFNLEVKIAGEISILWEKGSDAPIAIIANNTSGHFLPIDFHHDDLLDLVRSIFKLSSRSKIISITNTGLNANI